MLHENGRIQFTFKMSFLQKHVALIFTLLLGLLVVSGVAFYLIFDQTNENARGKENILTETLNIADKVIFAGAIPYEKIPDMINALDICIIPDSNEYRSPIKMFEYMAMGKPVVAPNYEPIRSVIDDGKDGVIFDPMDKENLVRILNNVVNDEGKRKILGNNAREKILKQHLWKHNAQKVLEIYRKVTAQ